MAPFFVDAKNLLRVSQPVDFTREAYLCMAVGHDLFEHFDSLAQVTDLRIALPAATNDVPLPPAGLN